MRLGGCYFLAFGVPPHTPFQSFLLITLLKTYCLKMEKGTRGSSLGTPSLLQAWLLASPSKQQNRGRRWLSTTSQFPPHTLLGPQGQVPLSYPVFFHHHLSGVCSELTSLPKMGIGLPEAKQMFLSLGCWGHPCHLHAGAEAARRRSFLKDTIKQLEKCAVVCLFVFFPRWKQISFPSFKGAGCKKPSRKSHYFKACQHHRNEGAWGDVDIG